MKIQNSEFRLHLGFAFTLLLGACGFISPSVVFSWFCRFRTLALTPLVVLVSRSLVLLHTPTQNTFKHIAYMPGENSLGVPIPAGPIQIPGRDGVFVPTNIAQSVGGTIYATTPGGTRIVYDRSALLFMRNSPLSKTPPSGMPVIPGVTCEAPASTGVSVPDDDEDYDSEEDDYIVAGDAPTDEGPIHTGGEEGDMFEMTL